MPTYCEYVSVRLQVDNDAASGLAVIDRAVSPVVSNSHIPRLGFLAELEH